MAAPDSKHRIECRLAVIFRQNWLPCDRQEPTQNGHTLFSKAAVRFGRQYLMTENFQ